MKPEHWRQVDQLFRAALERAPEEHATFISEACSGDVPLRSEAQALPLPMGKPQVLSNLPPTAR